MQTLSLIQIYPEPLPAFTEVQRDLAPLLPVVFESLDAGTSVCRQFYEQYCGGDQPRPHLREMIVRDQAKRYMNRNGLRVQELQERRFKLATEPLISLLLHYRGYAIRVLKGRSGIAPGCGTSRKRRAFYNQAPVRFLDEANMPAGSDTNLLALWDFTPEFGLAGLWLACPQVAGSRSQDVVLAWKELLPHPATAVAVNPSHLESGEAAVEQADRELESLLIGEAPQGEQDLWSQIDAMDATGPMKTEGSDDRQPHQVGA